MARWLIATGLVLVGLGLIMQFAPSLFGWFGKLPGDLDIRFGNSRVWVPLSSMILISLALTIILNLLNR
jgi:uncharacterized membrane protein